MDDARLYASSGQKTAGGDKYDFLIWDLETDTIQYYPTQQAYVNQAKIHGYPSPESFRDFFYYYDNHWGGLRFWLLT